MSQELVLVPKIKYEQLLKQTELVTSANPPPKNQSQQEEPMDKHTTKLEHIDQVDREVAMEDRTSENGKQATSSRENEHHATSSSQKKPLRNLYVERTVDDIKRAIKRKRSGSPVSQEPPSKRYNLHRESEGKEIWINYRI